MKTLKYDLILLFAATIWGLAFVAQRVGMEHVGPFTFNGLRFALGALALLPLLAYTLQKQKKGGRRQNLPEASQSESTNEVSSDATPPMPLNAALKGGIFAGIALFAGASFQQVGLVYTTAGKAGFITGLYVVIVPIMGLLWKERTGTGTWIGAGLATIGLYYLSVTEALTIEYGDFLELIGACCFATHVIIVGKLASKMNAVKLSVLQSIVCSFASLIIAFAIEHITLEAIRSAAIPIFYGGVCSVSIAYSLQIYGQKGSHPANAAILLSLESVVAAIGGWLFLNEIMSGRALMGCAIMMIGMLVSQLYPYMIHPGRFIVKTALNNQLEQTEK